MPSSYEKINYSIRPAKSIERKMFCEAFHRLPDIFKYKYIGFSSPFFTDFILIHKSLGITKMISIEKDIDKKDRFKFNIPYKCVKLLLGKSVDVLPGIKWGDPIIMWLDYDDKLEIDMLADIGTFIASAISGSIIIVTVNVEADGLDKEKLRPGCNYSEELLKHRYEMLLKRIGKSKVPLYITGKHLDNKENYKATYKIINNEINEILGKRNAGLEEDMFKYRQLFNFLYKDSSTMLSVGGILFNKSDEDRINRCKLGSLDFICSDDKPYLIEVPSLTLREIRYLNKFLPGKISNKGLEKITCISKEDKEKYSKIYRHFPNFVEAEI